jgi:hypothetical protein
MLAEAWSWAVGTAACTAAAAAVAVAALVVVVAADVAATAAAGSACAAAVADVEDRRCLVLVSSAALDGRSFKFEAFAV